MIFEVYGHYQPPALHRVAIHDASNQQLQQVKLPKMYRFSCIDITVFDRKTDITKMQKTSCLQKPSTMPLRSTTQPDPLQSACYCTHPCLYPNQSKAPNSTQPHHRKIQRIPTPPMTNLPNHKQP